MDKDIVEEGVEVSILQVLDNPNQTTSTLMIKILEFNKSFMINWVELDMLLFITNVSRKLPPLFRREMNRNGFNL